MRVATDCLYKHNDRLAWNPLREMIPPTTVILFIVKKVVDFPEELCYIVYRDRESDTMEAIPP